MKIHRFYISPEKAEIEAKFKVDDSELYNQFRNVLRFTAGTEVVLFDGSGFEYKAQVVEMSRGSVHFKVSGRKKGWVPEKNISLYQAMVKKDKCEWIAEKATEIGVEKIYFFVSERSEKKGLDMRRLEKKIVEAAEQSGRVVLPKVEFIENFQNAFSGSKNPIVFHTTGVLAREAGINEKKELDIFVGPEGGWTEKEV